LVSHIKTKTEIEGIQEEDAQEDFWVKREEITGQWRTLHNEKLHHLYAHQLLIKLWMRWMQHMM